MRCSSARAHAPGFHLQRSVRCWGAHSPASDLPVEIPKRSAAKRLDWMANLWWQRASHLKAGYGAQGAAVRVIHAADSATLCLCRQGDNGRLRYGHMLRDAHQFCSRNSSDDSESDAEDLHSRGALENSENEESSDDENSDGMYSDQEMLEAFQSELAADDEDSEEDKEREAEASEREIVQAKHDKGHKSKKDEPKDEYDWRPWNTKERVKACLDKLKKGPDGRYINALEVATEMDMLIASYLKLRKQDDPDRADNSEDDEKYLEGIDIRKFRKLQKRVRDGTYEFQPIVLVPLPKRKIVKLKRKKAKKKHAF